MTPLVWWVLLATFFGHARIVPARTYNIQNACAILCQAEKLLALNEVEKENVTVVDDDDEVEGIWGDDEEKEDDENYNGIHVTSQSVEGRRGLLRLVKKNDYDWSINDLCLVSERIQKFCQQFFANLRDRQGCNCQSIHSTVRSKNVISGRDIDPNTSNKLLDKFQQHQQQQQQQRFRQKEELEEEEKRQLLLAMKTMMKMMMRSGKEFSSMKDYYYYLPVIETNNEELVSSAPNPSASDEIDWEMWCMAQCDIGHGGSACECDIIP